MTAKRKILLLSTSDINGAYESIYRISRFLKEGGHEVAMVVKKKTQQDTFIYEVPFEKTFTQRVAASVKNRFFTRYLKARPEYLFLDEDESKPYYKTQDVLNAIPFVPEMVIAGMTDGFLVTHHLAEISKLTGARIFALTVDMSPLTGGCHYAWDCKGYTKDCSNCPAIVDERDKDKPMQNLRIKKANVTQAGIKIIAGSGWTLAQAAESALYKQQPKIESVIGCIDTNVLNNRNRDIAKRIFNIEDGTKLIFCGAQSLKDPRKGFAFFLEALNILHRELDPGITTQVKVLIVGRDNGELLVSQVPFAIHTIEYVKDYRLLSLAYQAADIFVCPSVEDSGPMMVTEALACGTPVVGFEMGAVSDMVKSGYNGYKAVLKDSQDLALGMKLMLTLSKEDYRQYSDNAVTQVEKHASYKVIVDQIGQL